MSYWHSFSAKILRVTLATITNKSLNFIALVQDQFIFYPQQYSQYGCPRSVGNNRLPLKIFVSNAL